MINLGLTSTEQRAFHAALASSHNVDVSVRVLTLERAYVADVSDQLFDGQVNIDSDADVTRNCTLSLRDVHHSLSFDTGSPNDAALYMDRMLSIVYQVSVPATGQWWRVPIFEGPITKMNRTADVVNLEAKGKESMMLPPTTAWYSKHYAKGIQKSAIARSILFNLGGETRFTFADWAAKTAVPTVVAYNTNIWAKAKQVIGNRAYWHLFYDGRGICVLRPTPKRSSWAFRTGAGGTIVSAPQIDYDMDSVRNTVRVTGGIPKGKKTPVVATSTATSSHPLSTRSLSRNGVQRIILEEVTDENLKTAAQCKALASEILDGILREAVTVTFDALVVPHLEPEDIFTVNTDNVSLTARVKQLSIPLKAGTMSVGYLSKRSANKARIRQKRR